MATLHKVGDRSALPAVNFGIYSLGHEVLRANGIEGATPVIAINSINPSSQELRIASLDQSVKTSRAVPAISSGEIVVSTRLLPGTLDYYHSLGIMAPGAQVIEVDIQRGCGKAEFGHPYGDVVHQLMNVRQFSQQDNAYLVPTNPNSQVSIQAQRLGLMELGLPDYSVTNNKRIIRMDSLEHGFEMLPGIVMATPADVETAVSMFACAPHGAWLKYELGSSGDHVRHIPLVTAESLTAEIAALRDAVLKMTWNRRSSGLKFWPKTSVGPVGMGLILESDARNYGEMIANGNTQLVTYKSGHVRVIETTRQRTESDGSFGGSITYKPDQNVKKLVEEVASRAVLANLRRGYHGVQGVDWFLIDVGGTPQVFVTEINARWNASTIPTIIAHKIGAEYWATLDVTVKNPQTGKPVKIKSADDYVRLVGEDLAFGTPGSGMAIPTVFASYAGANISRYSPDAKVMVVGSSEAHLDAVMQELRIRGIS